MKKRDKKSDAVAAELDVNAVEEKVQAVEAEMGAAETKEKTGTSHGSDGEANGKRSEEKTKEKTDKAEKKADRKADKKAGKKTKAKGKKGKRADSDEDVRFGAEMDFATKEAFNLLRTNLIYSFPSEGNDRGRIIGLTSSNPHEGKSSTAINLAYSLAEAGHRTLLVECDLRKPVLKRYLKFSAAEGLSDFLIGTEKNIIHEKILTDKLDVIFGGTIPLDPTVLLESPMMEKAFEALSAKYAYIVVDLPPVLAVPDAVLMAKYLSGMLFIVRAESAGKRDVQESIRRLKYTGVRMLGFVYNDNAESVSKKYYNKYSRYGKYYSKYSYHDGGKK